MSVIAIHPTTTRRLPRIAATFSAIAVVVLVASLTWQRHQALATRADRRVCQAMQGLDGKTYNPELEARIRSAGKGVLDHLGAIARHADARQWPGHLVLVSEDYTRIENRCVDVGAPAPNVD